MKRLSFALLLLISLILVLVSNDRAGRLMLSAGYPALAAHMLTDPAWRGAAYYQAGEYKSAIAVLQTTRSAEAAYNLGNAFARDGRLALAVKAYNIALKRNPGDNAAYANRQLVQYLLQTRKDAGDTVAGLASSTAAKEKQGGENKASDDDAGTKSTSGDGMAGQREAAGNAQMAGSSKVDRRGDAQDSALQAGKGSSKGSATDSGGSSGKNGGQTTRASADDTKPDPNTLETKLETEQATLQWLAQIPDDPVRFLRLRISAEHKQREEKGIAVQSKDSLW
ncbi:MAG: tetratricopeptide repeat protein [Phyllobacterium sp.]